MSIVEKALQNMLNLANDNSHGYDQNNRWGPDYDCSSAVIDSWEKAGVPVRTKGASYTGNMYQVFKSLGFVTVPVSERKRGDILLAHNTYTGKGHTAMVVDSNKIVHASLNEKGTITGGKSGDQTGGEICVRAYYDRPWDFCLRYVESDVVVVDVKPNLKPVTVNTFMISKGNCSPMVESIQALLNAKFNANLEVDGEFGSLTKNAVMYYQQAHSLEVDGVVGSETWNHLINK